MASYLHDGILLYLQDLVDWDGYFRLRKGDDVDVEAERGALVTVLETLAGICEEIEPEAREGWEEPAKLVDGEVIQPAYIQRGYEKMREAGLVSLAIREEYGGFGIPQLPANIVLQMVSRASPALMTVVGLQAGAANDIEKYASEELRQEYLPKFVSGEVQGSMDLTEPQAGSDLGGITTRATDKNGKTFLDGEKIFITNGGCEIHMVLARDDDTFDQSKGTTKGLSIFICPRTLKDGTKNNVFVDRLEHKMGLHGSPTAVVRFDHSEAFRIGEKGQGFKAMLDLMNNARLGVAGQGIGIAEAALSEAIAYARQREQFGQPIANQPLMKNMLARMVLDLEGSRALLYRVCVLVDRNQAIEAYLEREKGISDAEVAEFQRMHERNLVRIRLLTPLAKYMATESCDSITRAAIQVHGGIGFMAETFVGRAHLDGIITTIYEGTSEIQVSFALKEMAKGALTIVFDQLQKELSELTDPRFAELVEKVLRGIGCIEDASTSLLQDFSYALLCSQPVAQMVIDVIVGTELLRQANVDERRFDLAASWINRKMLEVEGNAKRIREGGVARIDRCGRIVELFE
jgi:alkylation response protein AidB-like acyl-CoA dehydrogenase